MDNLRRYQPSFRSRRGPNPVPWVRRLVVAAGVILVIVLLWRLGSSEPAPTDGNSNAAPLLTVASGNGNTNTAATVTPASVLTTDQCETPVSRGQDRKQVALTFTAGSGVGLTERLRDVVRERNLPATFFVSGQWATDHAAVAKSVAEAGFTLGNATFDRTNPTTLTAEQLADQLSRAEAAIQAATGRSSKPYFRPPLGSQNDDVVATARGAGYCTILWTVDAFDWQEGQTVEGAIQRVKDNGGNGAIIVLQVGSDLSADVVPALADALTADGFAFVSLDALLAS